jgi:hypothetical protein
VNEKIYVIPAKGLTVIDPANGRALPPDGKAVDAGVYWIRRLNEGDVTEGKAPAASAASAKPAAKSKE